MSRQTLSEAEQFYQEILSLLLKAKIPFLLGGTYALSHYTDLQRETKDLDIFCKAGDFQRILALLQEKGYKTELTDARWLAKVKKNGHLVDFISGTARNLWVVDDTWFTKAKTISFLNLQIKVIPPEEFLWSKIFFQDRYKYYGSDINYLIVKQGKTFDWKLILTRMEAQWEILLMTLISFRYVFPSEREIIPKWLMKELLSRVEHQFTIPTPKDKVCRGSTLSQVDYQIAIQEWGFHG